MLLSIHTWLQIELTFCLGATRANTDMWGRTSCSKSLYLLPLQVWRYEIAWRKYSNTNSQRDTRRLLYHNLLLNILLSKAIHFWHANSPIWNCCIQSPSFPGVSSVTPFRSQSVIWPDSCKAGLHKTTWLLFTTFKTTRMSMQCFKIDGCDLENLEKQSFSWIQ